MSKTEGASAAYEVHETLGALKPALMSIPAGLRYMGDVGRSKFYADILPKLETVKFGKRRLIVVESADRLIREGRTKGGEAAP